MTEQLAIDWTLDEAERRTLSLLRVRRGRGQAIKVPELARLVGIGERKLQTIVRRLCVEHGEPILSGRAGLWYLATEEELLASYREQRRKGISTIIRARANYRRHLARLRGQGDLSNVRTFERSEGAA